ncbi:VOC family protein [Virgibacillus xinjiangensis]|uniref:VOC family protein n=1 Tax=Virgibacillus xinjiangensis TaxID=393090 RepID=A0ABV7CZ68_9BACI
METKFFENPATYVGQVCINVTNLDRSIAFYEEVVGFNVLERAGNSASLTADGKRPILTIVEPEGSMPKEERKAGLFHFAILLPSREDLSSFLTHLIKAGRTLQLGASDHHVSEALYFNDPDGNGIEVYRDRLSDEWSWNGSTVKMVTDPLDADSLVAESDREWEGLPSDTVMGHIHLHVADLKKTEAFYKNGLGFDIVATYPGALFTSTAGYHHHIGLNIWNGEGAGKPSPNSAGLRWFSLLFPDKEMREKAIDRLQQSGVDVEETGEGYKVEDPSGNHIQLIV